MSNAAIRRQPARALAAVRSVVASAPVIQSERGEAEQTAVNILNYLEHNRGRPSAICQRGLTMPE